MVDVNRICRRHGGVTTWTFSQTDVAVYRRIFLDPKTRMGICAALSAYWIKCHAHDGSLVNELGGGGVGRLNFEKLREIAMLHSHVSVGADDSQQSYEIKLWLQMHDVLPLAGSREVMLDTFRFKGKQAQSFPLVATEGSGASIANIENNIALGLKKFNSCYARVNFGGKVLFKKTSHCVAVWLGQPTHRSQGDALFFDPNYGEFWFENKENFFCFFPEFYRATYLSMPYKFNMSWEVFPCAKRA